MKRYMGRLKPDSFNDIVALVALYRPGPLGTNMVDDFISNKHGSEIHYEHPLLKDILSDTYGLILYQEEVMEISRTLANYSLGEADLLRRAMGKKKKKEMELHRKKFIDGAAEKKISGHVANSIFSKMEKFAGYGFNKSHSAAYAQISYQTAYLKTHYPLEFFGALITSDMDNTDKVLRYIHDCREMKITVQPPDVNLSDRDFSVSDNKLVFGLGAIKNVGSKAIDNIIEARKELEKFNSLSQLCESVDLKLANKRVFESLIKSGACDSFGQSRAQMFKELQASMEQGQKKQRDQQLGQSSMFDTFLENVASEQSNGNHVEEWNETDRLKFEKESIGFYITGHPLDRFTKDLSWFTDATSASVAEATSNKIVSIAGIPIKHLPKTTRKGDKMGIITLDSS